MSQFNAGDVNVPINVYASLNLTGYTCTLVVLAPGQTVGTVLSCTVSEDGSYAYYNTTGTDFTAPGTYVCQLVAAKSSPATSFSSQQFNLQVGARIPT